MPKQRCEKHQIFIGKNGCKICNEVGKYKMANGVYEHWLSDATIEIKSLKGIIDGNKKSMKHQGEIISEKVKRIETLENDLKLVSNFNQSGIKTINNLYNENEFLKKEINFLMDRNIDIKNSASEKIELLKSDVKTLTEEINRLKSKELSPEIKEAIRYLSRNEKPIFTNLFAAESIIASCWDLYLQIPEKRRNSMTPFIDKIMDFCDNLNIFNTALAEKASKAMGNAEYNDMIVETIRVLDTASGKVKNCHTCIHALERKKLIKSELASGKK